MVNRVGAAVSGDDAWQFSWRVGLEVVDNHDPRWAPETTMGDRRLGIARRGATRRDLPGTRARRTRAICLQLGDRQIVRDGSWKLGGDELVSVLERDCERVARSCAVGDAVLDRRVDGLIAMPDGARVTATVEGFGRVSPQPL